MTRARRSGTVATPSDDFDDLTCAHCPDEVIRNYDGRGTGWSHIYPDGPDALRNGTKECRPSE